ncbi:hypothetical protein D9611_005481 [Ephemerocybe angulata]|uniref:CCHC-type domain-containing protein n=1 Tax=Ephemerocybe angulata TaxID=980116 RepID=A0A8H5FDI3_9AGAR|nr:hypothetical protein D9611_005481 [Tulosesus angulatus]
MEALQAALTTLAGTMTNLGSIVSSFATTFDRNSAELSTAASNLAAASDEQTVLAKEQTKLAAELAKHRANAALKKLKPDPPKEFNGAPERAGGFIAELEMYYDIMDVDDTKQQIIFALSKIKGGTNDMASHWADSQRTFIKNHEATDAEPSYFKNWKQFVVTFNSHFVIQNVSEAAIDKMRTLVQGSSTCEEYTILFQGYLTQSGYNEPAMLAEYKRGLNKALRDKIYGLIPMPTTLAEWAEKACTLDRQFRLAKGERHNEQTTQRRWAPRENNRPTHYAATPARDPNAMDIDRNRSPLICYTCGKPGHRSDSCRQAVPDVSCAYCKAKGHKITDCKSPNKKPFAPFAKDTTAPPQYTRVNDFDLSAMPESEIEALKAKLKDF